MSIVPIKESIPEGSIFASKEDKKSYDFIKYRIQRAFFTGVSRATFPVWVDEEGKRKYMEEGNLTRYLGEKNFLSPSALDHLEKQISKKGFNVSCSAPDLLIADLDDPYFKDHVYLNLVKVRINIPEVAKDESGYVSDGWHDNFRASTIKSHVDRRTEECFKATLTGVKRPLYRSKSFEG